MNKILITGAGGYIGSNSAYVFLQKGYQVVAIDNFSNGYQQPLELVKEKFPDTFSYYNLDLKDGIDEVFEKEQNIDAVVHYAAYCNVFESMKDPYLYFANNTYGCLNVLEAMTRHGVSKFIFSSTCATYGESQYAPLDEAHPQKPISPYGESKLMAEHTIEWYAKLKGLRYVILRYFNVCGASDDSLFGDSKKPSYALMQNAVRAALGLGEFKLVCPKVDTPDGTPIRDYINVVDLNEAHVAAYEYLAKDGESEVFNLGTGEGNSVLEIVHAVQKVTGKEFSLNSGETRTGDPAKLYASNEKIKRILKWEPKRSIEDSVRTLEKWYKERPDGWEK